jgi:hypothetical protein
MTPRDKIFAAVLVAVLIALIAVMTTWSGMEAL